MPRIFNNSQGQPLVDRRVKFTQDIYEWLIKTYGTDPATGLDRSYNAAVTTALRDLRNIKSPV